MDHRFHRETAQLEILLIILGKKIAWCLMTTRQLGCKTMTWYDYLPALTGATRLYTVTTVGNGQAVGIFY